MTSKENKGFTIISTSFLTKLQRYR